MYPQLSLYILTADPAIAQQLPPLLSDNRYYLNFFDSVSEFRKMIDQNLEQIDCLIISQEESILPIFNQLYEQATLLPTVLINPYAITLESSPLKTTSKKDYATDPDKNATYLYHSAELCLHVSRCFRMSFAHVCFTRSPWLSYVLYVSP